MMKVVKMGMNYIRDELEDLSFQKLNPEARNLVVDSNTISKFTIEIGEENVTSAIVLVSVDSATDTSKVSLKLAKLKGVKTVYEITGQYDITTIMSGSSIAEINNSIDALRKISGVVDTNTVIILRKIA